MKMKLIVDDIEVNLGVEFQKALISCIPDSPIYKDLMHILSQSNDADIRLSIAYNNAISKETDQRLKNAHIVLAREHVVIGTGGSVTTLAAMFHRIPSDDLTPERVNGLTLTLPQVVARFEEMRNLNVEQRVRLPGLDPERADVIVAGALVVMRIMVFFGVPELIVSMSDLLEGLLIED